MSLHPGKWCVEGNERLREKKKKGSRPYLLQLIPAMTADMPAPPTHTTKRATTPNEFRNVSYSSD
uniref:Uncharacterized protein n=1 Tax=Daphnia magna TaxID=35525 RepID=A0A0P6FX52_9CRUS